LERALLSRYSRAGVVVDDRLEVLQVLGQATPYLTLPAGDASLNLLKLIPETSLFLEVEKLVREVKKSGEAARRTQVRCGANGEVNIEVIPLGDPRGCALLVLFEPTPPVPDVEPVVTFDHTDREFARLKQDLADARQRLLSVVDEQHSAFEESQNTAADALSANEELQSLNEELETAKQELQSTNEELVTVNQQLLANNAALTEAHDFANFIFQTAASPLLVLDFELRIQKANRSFYGAFQISPPEAEGQLLYSVSNGCWDIPRLRTLLEGILPDHKAVEKFEIEQNFPTIGRRVLVLNAHQLDGLQQILVSIEDVTERQERAEATLQESEERFENMADAAPQMIWTSGPDKLRTFFNRGWLALTGRTIQQERGNGWLQNIHPDDLQNCRDTYLSAIDARRSFQMEYRLRRADGEYRWLLEDGVPRFKSGGVFAGYIGCCLDITDFKRTHEEYLAKLKMETLGTLAGGIAHDFNNLLGGVYAVSELALECLAEGSNPEKELQKIRDAAIRGSEIVRQLMVYAGEETESLDLVDVSEVITDMFELLKVSVSKHVRVETDLSDQLGAVRTNPSQIRQIVMNLLSNASEAIGDRDGLIRVTTARVTESSRSSLPFREQAF
jgi:two-component system, chemotaxis family, CheB/CheR fusion protein